MIHIFIILFSGVEIKVPRKHLISPESIQIQKELGNGEFGVVQQGVWIDKEQVEKTSRKNYCSNHFKKLFLNYFLDFFF